VAGAYQSLGVDAWGEAERDSTTERQSAYRRRRGDTVFQISTTMSRQPSM
jgi:hypothetical protein